MAVYTGIVGSSNPTGGTAGAGKATSRQILDPQTFADLCATANSNHARLEGTEQAAALDVNGNVLVGGTVTAAGKIQGAAGQGLALGGEVSLPSWAIYSGHVQTTDATATTIYTVATTNNSIVHLSARLVGLKSDRTQGAAYWQAAAFRNDGGTVTAVGSAVDVVAAQESDATWSGLSFVVSGTNVLLKATGKAATTINWGVTVEVVNREA